MIIDEGHRLKNSSSVLYGILKQVKGSNTPFLIADSAYPFFFYPDQGAISPPSYRDTCTEQPQRGE